MRAPASSTDSVAQADTAPTGPIATPESADDPEHTTAVARLELEKSRELATLRQQEGVATTADLALLASTDPDKPEEDLKYE